MISHVRIVFFLCLTINFYVFCNTKAQGQSNVSYKYMEVIWEELELVTSNEQPVPSDTMAVLCTTRKFYPTAYRKFSDEPDTASILRYVLAIRNNGRWKLFMKESLDEATRFFKYKRDIVYYVEGMGKTFTSNLYRAAGMTVQYQVNVVMFDYPSIHLNYSLIRNFRYAKRNSENSYKAFSALLHTIQKSKQLPYANIDSVSSTLFHHSMGNRMLQRALQQDVLLGIQDTLFDCVMLNAACVNQRKHNRWVEKITFSKKVLINYNTHDMQLNGAMIWTFRKQLGARVKKPLAKNASYICLNELIGKQHSVFLNRPDRPTRPKAAYDYYSAAFHGKPFDWKDTTKYAPSKKKIGVSLK